MSKLKSELVSRLKGTKSESKLVDIIDRGSLIQAMSRYHTMYEKKDAINWLVEYCLANGMSTKAEAIREGRYHYPMSITTVGFACRLASRGVSTDILPLSSIDDLIAKIKILPKKVIEVKSDTPSHPLMNHRVNPIMCDIIAQEDYITDGKKSSQIVLTGSKGDIDEAKNHALSMIKELKEFPEAYQREHIKPLNEFYMGIIGQAQDLINKSKPRKPRAKKQKPAEVLVKDLKFQTEFLELKLKSFNPVSLIGSREIIMYNSKTRQLHFIQTAEASGLNVKGTTIVGFNPKTSYYVKVRKPEDIFSDGTPSHTKLRTTMKGIKTTNYEANGRTNENMILLTILK